MIPYGRQWLDDEDIAGSDLTPQILRINIVCNGIDIRKHRSAAAVQYAIRRSRKSHCRGDYFISRLYPCRKTGKMKRRRPVGNCHRIVCPCVFCHFLFKLIRFRPGGDKIGSHHFRYRLYILIVQPLTSIWYHNLFLFFKHRIINDEYICAVF